MVKETRKKIVTKKHLARLERERLQRRYILIGAVVVMVLVIGFVAYGFLDLFVLRPLQPVARVGNDTVTTREFQTRARYARQNIIQRYNEMVQFVQMFGDDPSAQQYFQGSLQQLSMQLETNNLGQQVLDSMVEDLLIRQEAARRGITVSAEEVELELQEAFGYFADGTPTPSAPAPTLAPSTLSPTQLALVSPTPTITPTEVPTVTETVTPTPEFTATPTEIPAPTATLAPTIEPTPYTEQAYRDNYKSVIEGLTTAIDFKDADLRYIYESQLYREKLMAAVIGELPHEQEQVWARHILVADETTAQDLFTRLQNGEDFTALAAEFSLDGSSDMGGDLGWFSAEDMLEEFSQAAFSLEIGEISQPVLTSAGWHIIQSIGKEVRPLDDTAYERVRTAKFQEWLDAQREVSEVKIYDYWIDRVPTEPRLPTSSF